MLERRIVDTIRPIPAMSRSVVRKGVGGMLQNGITWSRNTIGIIVIFTVMALAGGIACGGSVSENFIGEWPRGVDRSIPGVTGDLELLLFSRGTNEILFRANGRAEGNGLRDNALYSLWLSDKAGNALLLDTGRADEECEEDPDTGEESDDCEVVLKLRSRLLQAPFNVTTLEGLTLDVREGPGTDGATVQAALKVIDLEGEVVLAFTVTESNL